MRRALKFVVLAGVVLATTAELDGTEIRCEEAMAHLEGCCAGFSAPQLCGTGCEPQTMDRGQSDCILATPCGPEADLICKRFDAMRGTSASSSSSSGYSYSATSSSTGSGVGASHGYTPPRVCP